MCIHICYFSFLYYGQHRHLPVQTHSVPTRLSSDFELEATGVGLVDQYALIDLTGNHDLAQLRTLQDWFLKFELETVPGVAEIASVGGKIGRASCRERVCQYV